MTADDPDRLSRRDLLKLGVVALPAVASEVGPAFALAQSAEPATPPDAQGRPIPTLVAGNTAFAFDLYAALRQDADANIVFSPYSVSQALAMVYAGANGETAAQIAETLAFGLPQPGLHQAFAALTADMVARGNADADSEPVYRGGVLVKQARGLRIANAVWGERTYPFSPAYGALLEQYYGVGLQQTDFKNTPEAARQEINTWVADQTEDRVQDIVPPDGTTPDTRLVLADAIWFSGGWVNPFDPEATEDDEFFLLDGTTVTVPFMFQHDHLNYARGDGFQVVELGYAGSDFAFTAILPDEGRFAAIEAELDADALDAAVKLLEYTEVLVHLPKFAFVFDAGLKPMLQAMGMADAFDPERADFTGMAEGTPPEPLYIDDALHKAFIGVDEEGTEAAAATVVEMVPGAAPPAEAPPEVRFDHPFIFAIRDTNSGTLLFLGRVTNPTV